MSCNGRRRMLNSIMEKDFWQVENVSYGTKHESLQHMRFGRASVLYLMFLLPATPLVVITFGLLPTWQVTAFIDIKLYIVLNICFTLYNVGCVLSTCTHLLMFFYYNAHLKMQMNLLVEYFHSTSVILRNEEDDLLDVYEVMIEGIKQHRKLLRLVR